MIRLSSLQSPQVFNRVKVTALTHPIENWDLSVICEPGLGRRLEYIYALTYSMPGCVEAVVEAEGDITKYYLVSEYLVLSFLISYL